MRAASGWQEREWDVREDSEGWKGVRLEKRNGI
jgi:hypothetical protein